jgi:GNAT superfamily N-acetyltransferase
VSALGDLDQVEIVGYDERFAADFKRLNLEWLERFGLLEPADLSSLEAPARTIIAVGGQIFFAIETGLVLGTCAVLPLSAQIAELVKLAVAPVGQGRGIGRRLAITAIEHARGWGAKKVTLISNSKLVTAVRLYETLGFKHAPVPQDTGYATANVYMELALAPRP